MPLGFIRLLNQAPCDKDGCTDRGKEKRRPQGKKPQASVTWGNDQDLDEQNT